MNLNVYEIEERVILQCDEVRPDEFRSGRVDDYSVIPPHGGLSDNM